MPARFYVSLPGSAEINFMVTADAVSSAAGGFRLVFSPAEGPLPFTLLRVTPIVITTGNTTRKLLKKIKVP